MKKIFLILLASVVVIGALLLMDDDKPQNPPAPGMEQGTERVEQQTLSKSPRLQSPEEPLAPENEADDAKVPPGNDPAVRSSNDETVSSSTADIAYANKKISETVQTVIGKGADYNTRLEAMRQLTEKIPPEDVAALMDYLSTPAPDGLAMSPIAYNSIKNDVMDLLLQQDQLPEGIGQLLTDIYNSSEHDEIWRNYSIQFMAPFYERASKEADSAPASQELKLVEETLWKALEERHNSNAGTALLSLNKLSDMFPEIGKPDVQAAMIDLAKDASASEANQITALRLCGEQGHDEVLNTARNVAQNGSTTILRCVAIATLGDLGTQEDLALLESFAASEDRRIQKIAQSSLSKLASP